MSITVRQRSHEEFYEVLNKFQRSWKSCRQVWNSRKRVLKILNSQAGLKTLSFIQSGIKVLKNLVEIWTGLKESEKVSANLAEFWINLGKYKKVSARFGMVVNVFRKNSREQVEKSWKCIRSKICLKWNLADITFIPKCNTFIPKCNFSQRLS